MGISRTPDELAAKLARHAAAVEKANLEAVTSIALQGKSEIAIQMMKATGGDMKLSGLGRGKSRTARKVRGASGKIGVRYDTGRESTPANPVVVLRATGPAHLVERDTDPHPIVPKGSKGVVSQRIRYRKDGSVAPGRTRSTRAGALMAVASGDLSGVRGVLKFSDGVYRRHVLNHPGTKGKHPFERGAEAIENDGGRIFEAEHRQALARTFGLG